MADYAALDGPTRPTVIANDSSHRLNAKSLTSGLQSRGASKETSENSFNVSVYHNVLINRHIFVVSVNSFNGNMAFNKTNPRYYCTYIYI